MEKNKYPTREEVLNSSGVHNLAKDVLRLTENKDVVDAYCDIRLVLNVLTQEMNKALR